MEGEVQFFMRDETKGNDINLAGSLLLAHPHLKDPHFTKSVVLMTAHEEEGSVGVVINSPTGMTLREVSDEFEQYELGEVPLYVGGPVSQEQIILAGWSISPDEGEFRLFFGLEPLVAQSKKASEENFTLRAYKGYAGWGKGQLLGELQANAWVVSEMDGLAVDTLEGDGLWRHIIMKINPELGLIALEPDSPESN